MNYQNSPRERLLLQMYGYMLDRLGPSQWWPGGSPFEVCIGAILTQNTNWSNVEKAILNLEEKSLLYPDKLFRLTEEELAELIRPAGYFRIKASRVKNFLFFLKNEASFDLEILSRQDLSQLRHKLLAVKGIGPETADSILLYALKKPTFVVDTYTARICNRHSLVPEDIGYEELRNYFMDVLPLDIDLFNEFHALLVRVGKHWCKKKSGLCGDCPLYSFL